MEILGWLQSKENNNIPFIFKNGVLIEKDSLVLREQIVNDILIVKKKGVNILNNNILIYFYNNNFYIEMFTNEKDSYNRQMPFIILIKDFNINMLLNYKDLIQKTIQNSGYTVEENTLVSVIECIKKYYSKKIVKKK